MKLRFKYLCFTFILVLSNVVNSNHPEGVPSDTYLLDSIKAVIYTDDEIDIVTESDVRRPSLDGNFRSLDDVILERLMFHDAKKFRIVPDEEAIDKHLQTMQRENDLTLEQLKEIFEQSGYTYEEGRQQFAVMSTVGMLLDFKIRSRLIIPEREVKQYYAENPVIEPVSYYLERLVLQVPAGKTKEEFQSALDEFVRSEGMTMAVSWAPPFWINEPDLATDKQFIKQMKIGQISKPVEMGRMFELFRLVDKKEERVVPLQDRYLEIASELRRPKHMQLFEDYKKELFDSFSVVYF